MQRTWRSVKHHGTLTEWHENIHRTPHTSLCRVDEAPWNSLIHPCARLMKPHGTPSYIPVSGWWSPIELPHTSLVPGWWSSMELLYQLLNAYLSYAYLSKLLVNKWNSEFRVLWNSLIHLCTRLMKLHGTPSYIPVPGWWSSTEFLHAYMVIHPIENYEDK